MFVDLVNRIDWTEDTVFFDVETVSTIEEMQRVASGELSKEERVKYLNPASAKYVAIGVFSNKVKRIGNLKVSRRNDKVIYYNTEPLTAEQIADLVLTVADKYGKKCIVAHNGKKFDFLVFLNGLHNGKLITLRFTKGSFYIQNCRTYYRLIDTIDLAKAMQSQSLDKLSQLLGIGQKNTKTAKTLQDYNVNDVVLLMEIAKKFKELGFQYTPTATARTFIAKVMEEKGFTKIKQTPFDIHVDYIGGRTEIFRHKGENIYCYDANSLYPSVMANMFFPAISVKGDVAEVKLHKIGSTVLIKEDIDEMNSLIWNAEPKNPVELKQLIDNTYDVHFLLFVRIKGIRKDIPEWAKRFAEQYFPYSYYDNDTGKRTFRLNRDRIYQVQGYEAVFLHFFEWELHTGYYYKPDRFFLASEMQQLYHKRQKLKAEGNLLQYFYKIVMNSSYGVFGLRDVIVQQLEKYLKRHRDRYTKGIGKFWFDVKQGRKQGKEGIIYKDPIVRLEVFTPFEGKEQLVVARQFSTFSIPIFAIAITSHARFWLHTVMLYLAKLGYKIYYTDTDSVFTNAPAFVFEELSLLGNGMLEWKLEYEIDRAYFFVPKCYVLKGKEFVKIKAKGTGREFIRQMTQTVVKKNDKKNKIVDYEVRNIERMFININSTPTKVPDINTPDWKSRFNDDGLTPLEAFDHKEIAEFLSTFDNKEYLEQYLKWLNDYTQLLKNELEIELPESVNEFAN